MDKLMNLKHRFFDENTKLDEFIRIHPVFHTRTQQGITSWPMFVHCLPGSTLRIFTAQTQEKKVWKYTRDIMDIA